MQVTLDNIPELGTFLRQYFLIGSIVSINGPMGVGKTTLLHHILPEFNVASPSFLHALQYGDHFLHIDAYTMTKNQFIELAIEELLFDKCIIIEWGNLVEDILSRFVASRFIINMNYIDQYRILEYSII